MEPITAAIVAALPALASETVKSGVKDAYEALKAVIRRKWGETAPISKSISALEEDPKSKAQAAVLEEKARAVNAAADPEVADVLKQLVNRLDAHGINVQVTMSGGQVVGPVGGGIINIGSISSRASPKP
jgi:hypothetical protein